MAVIGDPKQAIYGFRGADVHTYLAAREALLARGAARVPLRVNFRATPALIDATNALLDQQGRAPLFSGAITYDEPVRAGRPTLTLVDADGQPVPPVALWRYRPPPPRGRNQQSMPAWQLKQAFGRHLGRALGTLLSDPARRPTLVEHAGTADETRRTLTASDVFVLVRTGWEAVDAAGHLRRAGVPYSFYKQEGLFQTPEAWDVYDVLSAIARPHDRSARLRALATPFFGVPWRELAAWRTLPGNHPALERLHDWRLLAEREQHAALFHALLYDSGILERELFLRDTERELTNAQHILEVLLEVADARRLALPELLALLRRYIDGSEAPEGSDGNTQRLPTEQDAVQIMTMHKSKGLEAPIVCLYGGYSPGWRPDVQTVQDAAGARQVLVGEAALEAAAAPLERAAREEDERLLYVAMTRAAGQLYLPYVDSSRAVQGTYGPLNRRLAALVDGELPAGFVIEDVDARPPPAPDEAERRRALGTWRPPAGLLTAPDASARYAAARAAHAPLVVTSYTRMKQAREAAAALDLPIEADEFVQDHGAAAEVDDAALPGGRHVGRCLHEAIEALDFATLAAPFDDWRARPEVSDAFDAVMRVHGVEARWKSVAQRLVYDTLTRPVRLGDATVDGLFGCREVRELEFLFPLPERSHPLLTGGDAEGRWQVERGFVKGFVDLVFEHDGRTWWADWKSDTLRTYDPATIEAHVADHYDLQAQLYTLGLVRLLGLRDAEDYAARFGGYLYVFLRGMGEDAPPDHGVYVARPGWAQVVAWERALCDEAVS